MLSPAAHGGFHRVLVALVSTLALGAACDAETTLRYVDPPVVLDEAEDETAGAPELAIGLYDDEGFRPLGNGSECPLIAGFQGGLWIMPAIRTRGLDSPAEVTVTLTIVEGQPITNVSTKANFVLASDGWLEIKAFPARVDYAEWKIQELYGLTGELALTVVDGEGRSATIAVDIVLVQAEG
jgi:hypothetical protein